MTMHFRNGAIRVFAVCLFCVPIAKLSAQELPLVRNVELQPLAAQVERVVQAMELAGSPLAAEQRGDSNGTR